MKEMEIVTLEDDNNYIIIDTIDKYVYITKEEDKEYFGIRKIEFQDREEYFVGLDNDEEFDRAFDLFRAKYNN